MSRKGLITRRWENSNIILNLIPYLWKKTNTFCAFHKFCLIKIQFSIPKSIISRWFWSGWDENINKFYSFGSVNDNLQYDFFVKLVVCKLYGLKWNGSKFTRALIPYSIQKQANIQKLQPLKFHEALIINWWHLRETPVRDFEHSGGYNSG